MLKTMFRLLLIALFAMALGYIIYHFGLPATASRFGAKVGEVGRLSVGFGGDRELREGGFGLARGLFGVAGNLLLIGIITAIVVSMQKALSPQPQSMRPR